MKPLTIFIALISIIGYGQDSTGQDIIVKISNFDSDDGKAIIGLYDSEAKWLSKTIDGKVSKIENETCEVVFENVPKGTYAISLFHDENDNDKLDTNFLGIPKEDTGSSNNAPARFGPPKWSAAKFEVANETVIQNIKL